MNESGFRAWPHRNVGGMSPRIASEVLALLALLNTSIRAQDSPAPPAPIAHVSPAPRGRPITIDEALAAADAAPEVVVARAEERTAEANIAVARALPSPTLSVGTHSITARESVAVSTPFRWLGQRRAAVDAAASDFETAIRSRESTRAAARRSVRVAWFRLAAAEQAAKIASDLADRARQNSEAVSQQFDSGRTARIDVVRAQAEAAVALAESREAELSRGTAMTTLGLLIGREPGQEMLVSGDLPTPDSDGPLDEWLARAAFSSPEVRLQQQRVEAATRRLTLTRRQRWPGLGVEVGADFDDPTQPGTDKFAAMTLTLPLDGSPKGRVAEAEKARETAELQRVKSAAMAGVESAWRAATAALSRYEALNGTALPAARESADLARFAYREGRLDLFRLLDAERSLSQAEKGRWDSYAEWGAAHADLLWIAGADSQ